MSHLLDTHALIWFLYDDPRLSHRARNLCETSNDLRASICSLWEIAIKQSIGKLDVEDSVERIAEVCEEQGIALLPILPKHLDRIRKLPYAHKDPFDRLLVAQAQCEGLSLITRDSRIGEYDVHIEW